MIIPIRTQSPIHRAPYVNFALIAANMLVFLVLDEKLVGPAVKAIKEDYLVLNAGEPRLWQFVTYQFLHADAWHLFGNMLFLWVFGNSVNGKMGGLPYFLFYISGGVFAAWGWASMTPGPSYLLGASGSIAAVTTAYLALFPRSRVTVLIWLIFIYFFEVSAMVIILLKIIVWDNILAPSIGGSGNVANEAHLAGYLFGFLGAMVMLLVRALPRDQFDMLAVWRRWTLRREFASAMAGPEAEARAKFGAAARMETLSPERRAAEEAKLDRIEELRSRVANAFEQGDMTGATGAYEAMLVVDADQCLSEMQQMAVARAYFDRGDHEKAVGAFERFAASYTRSRERGQVLMLLGIIYARDLQRYELADERLTSALKELQLAERREQCLHWLRDVREKLGRALPGTEAQGQS